MRNELNREKLIFASSFFKLFLIISVFVLIGFFLIFEFCSTHKLLIVGQDNNIVYYEIDVEVNDKLKYGWIHSFEHIPWTEEYYIQENNHLILDTITIAGFGAGIPHNKGTQTKIEDGIIYYEDINQDFEYIEWIHSQTALEYIKLNDEILLEGIDLEHHEFYKLKIEKRVDICQRLK